MTSSSTMQEFHRLYFLGLSVVVFITSIAAAVPVDNNPIHQHHGNGKIDQLEDTGGHHGDQFYIEFPQDAVAAHGENVIFTCSIDASTGIFVWQREEPSYIIYSFDNDVGGTLVADPAKYDVRYTSQFVFQLIIKDVDWIDGARYSCSLLGDVKHRADLVVLDSVTLLTAPYILPICNGELTFTCIGVYGLHDTSRLDPYLDPHITCEVQDSSAQAGHLTKIYGVPGQSFWAIEKVCIWKIPQQSSASSVVLTAKCFMHSGLRNLSANGDVIALRPPQPVQDIIIGLPTQVYVGSTIFCHAEAYPLPSFRWENKIRLQYQQNHVGETLHITKGMLGPNEWMCTAWNGPQSIATRYAEFTVSYAQGCGDFEDEVVPPKSGVYEIHPSGVIKPFYVLCHFYDHNSNGLGAWTVLQQRVDNSTDFYRNWADYKAGFGHVDNHGNFWLGNDYITALTSQRDYELRVDLVDENGLEMYADFSFFHVSSEAENYRLNLGYYLGGNHAGHGNLDYHDGMSFSTHDRDNDLQNYNCATYYHSAWWYGSCVTSDLNMPYNDGTAFVRHGEITWETHRNVIHITRMKIRPATHSMSSIGTTDIGTTDKYFD